MKSLKLILFLLFFIFFNLNNVFGENAKVDEISKNLRCLICQGQSVYDSQSEFALSVKTLISNKLEAGSSEKDIYDFLKSKYQNHYIQLPSQSLEQIILSLYCQMIQSNLNFSPRLEEVGY